jgi:predicted transposase/invertase (TIGR01784 family)
MSDPRRDRIFKHSFHNRPEALKSLLNSFLPWEHPIVGIEYLPEELHDDSPDGRLSILDVRCRDSMGRQFIVEMQMQHTPFLLQRLVWNAARVMIRQLGKGSRYAVVQPDYTLCLLDPHLIPGSPDWIHHFDTRSQTPEAPIMPGLHFTIVELRKWMEKGNFDKRDIRHGWMAFFHKPAATKDIYTPEEQQEYDEIFQAVKAWDLSRYSYEELCIMDRKLDDYMTHNAFVDFYYSEGRTAGMQEGFQQGLEQGRKQGFEQGRKEAFQGFLMAMQLMRTLREHPEMSDEDIARTIGIPADEVKQARTIL